MKKSVSVFGFECEKHIKTALDISFKKFLFWWTEFVGLLLDWG